MIEADAAVQDAITDEEARFFVENGLLAIRNVLAPAELAALRDETRRLVERAAEETDDPDFVRREHGLTGERVPYRVEYVVAKSQACRRLLGHPFVLRSIEKLQGPAFIPTWDSMVFKLEGAGAAVPWHRDAGDEQVFDERPILNVGFYLDESDFTNCLWGIPGSNRWSEEEARARVAELSRDGFGTGGAVPLPMRPGDALLHDIRVLHGSPPARSTLRRILYYEFRPVEGELAIGPHTPEYVPLKQQVLLGCLRARTVAPYAAGETPFAYRGGDVPAGEPPSYRVPHAEHWLEDRRERWTAA